MKKNRRFLIGSVVLSAVTACSCAGTWAAPKSDSVLEKVVSDAVHEFQPVPDSGIAIAVVKEGRAIFSEGFGFRDRRSLTKVSPDTFFAIGSATKAFTSMAISMMAEEGKIALDIPIIQYLSDFKVKDPDATKNMTLEDILSHRTGVPRHDVLWYLGPFNQSELFHRLQYLDPNTNANKGFRKAFEYNNMMYTVGGMLLEKLTGTSWKNFVKGHIFDPLEMTGSDFSVKSFSHKSNYAKGYAKETELDLKDVENIGPAGAINSNILEMTNWVLLHLNHGMTSKGTGIISRSSLEKMYSHYMETPEVGPGVFYGLGWFVGQVQGKRLVFHQGHTDGYSAYISFMPDDQMAVIALTNQQKNLFPDLVAERIYNYLLNGSVKNPIHLPMQKITYLHEPDSAALSMIRNINDYVGSFSNSGYGDISIQQVDNELVLNYYQHNWPLHQISDLVFYFDLYAYGTSFKVPVRFTKNAAGKIDSLNIPFEPKVPMIRFDIL